MTDILWTAQDAAKATGGEARGDWNATGLSIDTRSLQWGDLFVPLKDQRDGHEFIPQARAAGACAVISERNEEFSPALIVKDSLQALRDLARAAHMRSTAKRLAVTGSVGKTSLKEALAAICVSVGATHKSQKSYNNHWGVPLTLATMPPATQFGVFELGMNHAGELSDLSAIVRPEIAIITKIAPAHLAHFDNVDAIARAKSEIFDGLETGGMAVLNADDHYFTFLSDIAGKAGAQILSFGRSQQADIRIENPLAKAGQVSCDLKIEGRAYGLRLPIDGEHWIENGACAVAAAMAAGISPDQAISALAGFRALPGRGDVVDAMVDGKVVTLIDDSYNANPESMRAAILALGGRAANRKIAVLGDMFELGREELSLHADLAEPLKAQNVSRVIFVGECMRALKGALPQTMRGAWVRDWESALSALRDEIQDGDTILVKGSNATGLGNLVAEIRKMQKGVSHVL